MEIQQREMIEYKIIQAFKEHRGNDPVSFERMKGDASHRTLYRLKDSHGSMIGVYGPSIEENRAFLSFTKTFRDLQLPVPELYHVCDDQQIYFLEDLGNTTLFTLLNEQREMTGGAFPYKVMKPLYGQAVEMLVHFQCETITSLDLDVCYQGQDFNREAWRRDQMYFMNSFLKVLKKEEIAEDSIQHDLNCHLDILEQFPANFFLYRDFQSRNIMVTADGLRFIDYQSGRRGAVTYDIVSLLFDSRANLPSKFQRDLFAFHCHLIQDQMAMPVDELESAFHPYALLRILQVLGAYSNLGILQGRTEYISAIPFAIRNALRVIRDDERLQKLSYLETILSELQETQPWNDLS